MDKRLLEFYNDLACAFVFGKYIFYPRHQWRRHLHIKMNDVCNKKCPFCIERGNQCIESVSEDYYTKLEYVIKELISNNVIKTISITGGEPLFNIDKLCRVLEITNKYSFDFININTNGQYLNEHSQVLRKYKIDCINVSRHHYDDCLNDNLFGTKSELQLPNLPNTKLRLQCVCLRDFIDSKDEIESYIHFYKGQVYDFSFRQLIKPEHTGPCFEYWEKNNVSLKPVYKQFLNDDNYTMSFIHNDEYEYYVEFIHKIDSAKRFLLCYTDMGKIYNIEKIESDNIIREFIYFPNGLLSGSWSKTRKIILEDK